MTSTACYAQFPADKPDDEPYLDIRGALRFNNNLSIWKEDQLKRGGNFGFEILCINVEAEYKGIKLNAEYRLNAAGFGGGMLKKGWFQYDFSEASQVQVGLT